MRVFKSRSALACIATAALLLASGCAGKDKTSPEEYLPDSEQVVEIDGQRLDHSAGPDLVAWVLLQTLAQDNAAGNDLERRREMWKQACSLAHVEVLDIFARTITAQTKGDPQELTFDLIRGWAPIIRAYVPYFDADLDSAAKHMRVTASRINNVGSAQKSFDKATVDYALLGESRGGPRGLAIGVTIRVSLAKSENGYWRVFKVSYAKSPDLSAASSNGSE